MDGIDRSARTVAVPRWLERCGAWSWRLVALAGATVVAVWLLRRLWVVVFAAFIAVLLTRALEGPTRRLRRRRWPRGLAAATVLVAFLISVTGTLTVIGVSVAGTSDEIGTTLNAALDDIERWLVEDSPFDLDAAEVRDLRAEATDTFREGWRTSGGSVLDGARLALEGVFAILLGLILTFFALKDGSVLVPWLRERTPTDRRAAFDRIGASAWHTLGGYLRGAAILGLVEGIIIGVTLALVGAELAVVVGLLTFVAAFVPFIGAIAAAAVATLVALATGGTVPALVVLAVALVVQQLDNDLLAPMIYGRSLSLHPAVVLVVVAAGGALFGIAGSILAVPLAAVAINVAAEERRARRSHATSAVPDAC